MIGTEAASLGSVRFPAADACAGKPFTGIGQGDVKHPIGCRILLEAIAQTFCANVYCPC